MFKDFFNKLPRDLADVFSRRNLVWHFLAITVTYFLVNSGFDWWYYESTRNATLQNVALTAAIAGFFVPIVVPVGMYIVGEFKKDIRLMSIGAAVARAEIIGLLVSSAYKAFTGRIQPEFYTHLSNIDVSRDFNFGFWQHGIFWGWPSSHTAVAFAGAVALVVICARNKTVRYLALLYAFFIGLGVSVTIHWFSDFVAGAIIGSIIGVVVAKSFLNRTQ